MLLRTDAILYTLIDPYHVRDLFFKYVSHGALFPVFSILFLNSNEDNNNLTKVIIISLRFEEIKHKAVAVWSPEAIIICIKRSVSRKKCL